MSGYLPVGSVIKVDGTEAVILGNTNVTEENSLIDVYLVAKYPLGYMGPKSVFMVSANAEMEVLFEGYSYEDADRYLAAKRKFNDSLKPLGAENAKKVIENMNNIAKGGKKDD